MRAFSGGAAIAAVAIAMAANGAGGSAKAAEGAASHYLPGVAGDFGLALPPAPGWQTANVVWSQSGNIGAAVLQGQVDLGLNLDIVLDIVAANYTFEQTILGGTYTFGVAVPFGYANLDAKLSAAIGSVKGSADSFNLSDIVIIPAQLNWTTGKFSFKLAEQVIAPTGAYNVNDAVNLGRNYWSFDTVAAITYFNPATGLEISAAPGLMLNTKNTATNYQTGTEFHVDFTVNQFLSETFSLGLRGYYYKQVSGDSGSGALLGDFKGESLGLGPGFLWLPAAGQGNLSVAGKWMWDTMAKNRFDSEYGLLTVGWHF